MIWICRDAPGSSHVRSTCSIFASMIFEIFSRFHSHGRRVHKNIHAVLSLMFKEFIIFSPSIGPWNFIKKLYWKNVIFDQKIDLRQNNLAKFLVKNNYLDENLGYTFLGQILARNFQKITFGCLAKTRSSFLEWANWHFLPYRHIPVSSNDRHNSVLYSDVLWTKNVIFEKRRRLEVAFDLKVEN